MNRIVHIFVPQNFYTKFCIQAFMLGFLLLSCSSCLYQHLSISSFSGKEIPIFIAMPRNPLIFENISPVIYDAVYNQYRQVGYELVDTQSDGYTVAITIKNMTTPIKFVSPDIVLLHYRIKLELDVQLLNFNQEVVAQKLFVFTRIISEPRDPALNTAFTDYEYRRLLEHAAPKIERYFRPFLIKAFDVKKPDVKTKQSQNKQP